MLIRAHGFVVEVPDDFLGIRSNVSESSPSSSLRVTLSSRAQAADIQVDDAVCGRLDGDHLSVWPLVDLGPRTIEHYVLDHLVPAALGLLGHTVLHASGAARCDCGIVFTGPSGSGKSTLALWLASRGWSWFGDDAIRLAPARTSELKLLMWPSYPGARIHADGTQQIFAELASSGPVNDGGTKQRLEVPADRVAATPTSAVLLVSFDPEPGAPRLTELSVAETAHVIAQQSFMPSTDDRLAAIDRLDRALGLAPAIRGMRLRHPRTVDALAAIEVLLVEALGEQGHVTEPA